MLDSFTAQCDEVANDQLGSLKRVQEILEESSGKKVLDTQNAYDALIQLGSKTLAETQEFDRRIKQYLTQSVMAVFKQAAKTGGKSALEAWKKTRKAGFRWGVGNWDLEDNPLLAELNHYVMSKHGIENNRDLAVRTVLFAKADKLYSEALDNALAPIHEELEAMKGAEFVERDEIRAKREELANNKRQLKAELDALKAAKASADDIRAKSDGWHNAVAEESQYREDTKDRLKEINDKENELKRKKGDILNFPTRHGLRTQSDMREVLLSDWYDRIKEIREKNLTWEEKQREMDLLAVSEGADLSQDYSGLSSIYGEDFTEEAYAAVNEYEKRIGEKLISNLWREIRNTTGFSLDKQRRTGIAPDNYVKSNERRFEFFVPLRGFADKTGEDVYQYLHESYAQASNPVKAREGRTSEAGNAFASMLQVAYSSINFGNRNAAKTKFYNLVSSHPSDLAVVQYTWYRNTQTDLSQTPKPEDWVPVEPPIKPGMSAQQIAETLSKWNADMEEERKIGMAKTGREMDMPEVPYRITSTADKDEHYVRMYIHGKPVEIFIAGNPRVAQAINGLLNPDFGAKRYPIVRAWNKLKNYKAGILTSWNANFATGNIARDSKFSYVNADARFGSKFAKAFRKHQSSYIGYVPLVGATVGAYGKWVEMGHLLRLYQNGSDPKTGLQKTFHSFMANGGATGYTFMVDQERARQMMEESLYDLIHSAWYNPTQWVKALGNLIELVTQSSELVNRFAAYQAGKDLGWTESKCIRAAKEISLNFNRKGSSYKGFDTNSTGVKGAAIKTLAGATAVGQFTEVFFNAGMQDKAALMYAFHNNPVKSTWHFMLKPMALGAMMPFICNYGLPFLYSYLYGLIGGGDGDDDENYYDLSDYTRQHYICLRLPYKFGWAKVALPQAIAPFWAIGDVTMGWATGEREIDPAMDYGSIVSDIVLPLGVNWEVIRRKGGQGAIRELFGDTPVSHFVDYGTNTNFMGGDIYKEDHNFKQSLKPDYMKGNRSTSPVLTKGFEWLNGADGNAVKKGTISLNPAVFEHLAKGTLGGFYEVPQNVADLIYQAVNPKGEQTAEWSDIIEAVGVTNRLYMSGGSKATDERTSSKYFREVIQFIQKMEYEENGYKQQLKSKEARTDDLVHAEYSTQYNKFKESDDYKMYRQIVHEANRIKHLEDTNDKRDIENDPILTERKRELLRLMTELRNK